MSYRDTLMFWTHLLKMIKRIICSIKNLSLNEGIQGCIALVRILRLIWHILTMEHKVSTKNQLKLLLRTISPFSNVI